MIRGIKVSRGLTFLTLTWTPPQYIPLEYQISAIYTVQFDGTRYARDYTPIPGVHAPDGNPVQAFVAERLTPSTDCRIHFKAVYNRASLDPGIYITTTTLTASK